MPDLESVIHSFNCCENSPCEDCSYYDSTDETSCGWRLISDAVALLKGKLLLCHLQGEPELPVLERHPHPQGTRPHTLEGTL